MWFDTPAIRALIDLGLTEDVGSGDTATEATIAAATQGSAVVRAKEDLIVCGGPMFAAVMRRIDPAVEVTQLIAEGTEAHPGDVVLQLRGPLRGILVGERPALNFLGRMSGIATFARACADAVAGTATRVVDTRKTLPAYRSLDKYAVRTGGCSNHRTALDAGVMIKENHIAACGSLAVAIGAAKERASHLIRIEVEIERIEQLEEVLAAGADVVLLDNMSNDQMRACVALNGGRAILEASGNMTLERLAGVAATGVDFISMGALTHTVKNADLSLRVAP
jgi:nicotinate-nucleotide pyrophosphorylase (carboxylating)